MDYTQAYLSYDLKSGDYNKLSPNFAQFSPAYVVSNEDVRDALRVLQPAPGASVLTVAGSGDQALFYKLAGAGCVDTFDITYNAKVIMDIKTSAIQKLEQIEYLRLLSQINHSRDICEIAQYKQIVDCMPNDTHEYLNMMRGAHLVRGGSTYMDTVLFKNEYAQAKNLIKEPFTFIWTELAGLASKLTQKYDQIYLSNILQYNVNTDYVVNVICDLGACLNPQGKILVNIAPWFDGDELIVMKNLQALVAQTSMGRVKFIQNHVHHMCVLEKR